MPPVLSPAQHPTARGLDMGRLLIPVSGTAARTDIGADGEVHAYRSGGSIYFGMYNATAAAWQYVQLI